MFTPIENIEWGSCIKGLYLRSRKSFDLCIDVSSLQSHASKPDNMNAIAPSLNHFAIKINNDWSAVWKRSIYLGNSRRKSFCFDVETDPFNFRIQSHVQRWRSEIRPTGWLHSNSLKCIKRSAANESLRNLQSFRKFVCFIFDAVRLGWGFNSFK